MGKDKQKPKTCPIIETVDNLLNDAKIKLCSNCPLCDEKVKEAVKSELCVEDFMEEE